MSSTGDCSYCRQSRLPQLSGIGHTGMLLERPSGDKRDRRMSILGHSFLFLTLLLYSCTLHLHDQGFGYRHSCGPVIVFWICQRAGVQGQNWYGSQLIVYDCRVMGDYNDVLPVSGLLFHLDVKARRFLSPSDPKSSL